MIKRKKMISLLLVLTLVSGMFVQTYATEIDDTKKKAEELGRIVQMIRVKD